MTAPTRLNRALTLSSASAISTGLAFAAINFLGLGQMLGYIDGRLAWLPVLIGGALILTVRALFAELNGIHPSAAGIRLWLARAMHDRRALVITLTYMSAIVLVIAADAFIIGEAIAYVFHNGRLIAVGYVTALLAVATFINLRGIKLAGRAENVVTSVTVGLTVVVGIVAIVHPGAAPPATNLGTGSLVQAVILGIFVYTGFEWVTANAEETVRSSIIPRAMLIAIVVLAVSQTVFAVAMGRTLDADGRVSAYPQLLVAQQAMGRAGLVLMLGVTALTAVNTFNGGFVTLSRFMYALAREAKLPPAFARLNSRAVPAAPVWTLGAVSLGLAVVVAATNSFAIMVSVGATLEMMIYACAGFVVWRLRRREPAHPRPFRLFGGRPAALTLTILFGLLALLASVSVGTTVTPVPLLIILGFAAIVTVYSYTYVPRLARREEAAAAARRAARAAARASRLASAEPSAQSASVQSASVQSASVQPASAQPASSGVFRAEGQAVVPDEA